MSSKLGTVAEQSWRKLNAPKLMQDVYGGKRVKDRIGVETKAEGAGDARILLHICQLHLGG